MKDALIKYNYLWPIISTNYKAKVRKVFEISRLDRVICGIVNKMQNKEIQFEDLGLMLGFGTKNILDFSETIKFYKDEAEINILNGLIEKCSKFHLVNINKETSLVKITDWGIHALEHGKKYEFWECTLSSYSHIDFILGDQLDLYPFFELGLMIDITQKKLLNEVYDFPEKRNDLTKELIFYLSQSEQKAKFIIDEVNDHDFVDKNIIYKIFDVYLFKDQNSLAFKFNEIELNKISTSITLKENNELQAYLQRKGLYLHLLSGNELLTPSNLSPFIEDDFFEPTNIVKSGKVDWDSKEIFAFFLNESFSDNSLWTAISNSCPIELILQNIDQLNDYISWTILTQRAENNEILNKPKLEWDIELIIEQFSEDELLQFLEKRLLNIPKVSDDDETTSYLDVFSIYSWNLITEKFNDENLEKHLFDYPFNLRFITVNKEALCKKLLLEKEKWEKDIFSREWDWRYISGNYDPDFLSNNFTLFKSYLDAGNLFLQIAKSEIRLTRFLKSNQTISLKEKLAEDSFKLSSHHQVFLNEETLGLLEEHNLLAWGEKGVNGIETNPGIKWTNSIVKKYGYNIQSDKAFKLVSIRLDEIETAVYNYQLAWDWISIINHYDGKVVFDNWLKIHGFLNTDIQPEAYNILSEKISLLQAIELCTKIQNIQEFFNWSLLFKKSSELEIEELYETINDLLLDILNEDCISICTQKVGLEYILKHKELLWNWLIVSSKKIKLEDAEKYFNELAPFLDWEYITQNLYSSKEFNDIESLTELAWYIDKGKDSAKKSAWKYITQQLNPEFIWVFINSTRELSTFHWDWNIISGSPIFLKGHIEDLRSGYNRFFIENSRLLNWSSFTENTYYKGYLIKRDFEKLYTWLDRIDNLITPIVKYLDWSLLSANVDFTWNSQIVDRYFKYWDWKVFSEYSENLIRRKGGGIIFDYRNINALRRVLDFNILSSRRGIIMDQNLIGRFGHENLNWEILSSNPLFYFSWEVFFINGDINKELTHDKFNQPIVDKQWDFYALSKREDALFTTELVLKLIDKNWDWDYFSCQSFITNNLLVETLDKSWNWVLISQNRELVFDEKLINILLEKDSNNIIDWGITSSNPHFHITYRTLSQFSDVKLKSLNWNELSRSENLDIEILNSELLDKYSNYWNWEILLKKEKIFLSSKLLLRYHSYIPASTIAEHIKPEVLTDSSLNSIRENIDWGIICQREDFKSLLSNTEFISENKNFLKWEIISGQTQIPFTKELINSYYPFWDWSILKQNPCIVESPELISHVNSCIESDHRLLFLDKISQQYSNWSGYIYHFTHLPNAVKVLNSSSILSRNSALTKLDHFDDAAGSVVNRRDLAHNYARFYFRPKTPTQFYNEELGQDRSHLYERTYSRALNLGLPKCPIPVFFRFRLKDILFDDKIEYKISNGNMQTNWARLLEINSAIHAFDFDEVYSTFPDYRDYGSYDGFDRAGFQQAIKTYIDKSQQEFLVKDQLNFSDYFYYEIIVKDEFTKEYLLEVLEDERHKKRIVVNDYNYDIFHNENRSIQIGKSKTNIQIKTDYCNKHRFKITFFEPFEVEEVEGTNVILKNKLLEFEEELSLNLKEEVGYKIEFYNELKSEPWELISINNKKPIHQSPSINFSTKELEPSQILQYLKTSYPRLHSAFESKVRHYQLGHHTLLVMNQFERYFRNIDLPISKNLFRLTLALHDIGKPQAFAQGDKSNQYFYTKELMNHIQSSFPFGEDDYNVCLSLISDDPIGKCFQSQISIKAAAALIHDASEKTKLSIDAFFQLQLIYYQCDTGSYTKDAGGLAFLEHLFMYEQEDKVFNIEKQRLIFSAQLESKLKELKNEITYLAILEKQT